MGGDVNFNIVALISLIHHLPVFGTSLDLALHFAQLFLFFPATRVWNATQFFFHRNISEAFCFEYNDRDHLSYVYSRPSYQVSTSTMIFKKFNKFRLTGRPSHF